MTYSLAYAIVPPAVAFVAMTGFESARQKHLIIRITLVWDDGDL